jgi:uncharacterized membrane protein
MSLANTDELFLYVGEYSDLEAAEGDYDAIKALHTVDLIGTFDAAVVTKSEDGEIKIVHHTEKPTQHGGWGGLAVGAVIGVIFPPAIVGTALAGAAVGAVGGHLSGGLPRGELKALADALEPGDAAVVAIAEPTVEEAIEKAAIHAKRELKRAVKANAKELEREIDALPTS